MGMTRVMQPESESWESVDVLSLEQEAKKIITADNRIQPYRIEVFITPGFVV